VEWLGEKSRMSLKRHPLETYIAQRLTEITNFQCRPTRASGASVEILDVYNPLFYVECKWTENTADLLIKWKEVAKAMYQIKDANSDKPLLFAWQAKGKNRWAMMSYLAMEELLEKNSEYKIEDLFLINYKEMSENKSFRINLDEWNTIYDNSLQKNDTKIPAVVIVYCKAEMFIIMDLDDFFILLEDIIIGE